MAHRDKIELLTSLVDGEISDQQLENELKTLIETDSTAAYDYKVQLLIKNLVKMNMGFVQAPERLHKKINRRLLRETTPANDPALTLIFTPSFMTYATAAVIVLAIILILFNRPPIVDTYNFAAGQQGKDNMFVQAQNNFSAIIQGRLQPQLLSDNAQTIQEFFKQSGVKYSTIVPVFENLTLLGAVVSDEQGKKCAHHVYTNSDGKIVYLYQVDETELVSGERLKLTPDLLNFLDEGRCYSFSSQTTSTLLVKSKKNICAIVSDLSARELNESFCNLN
ncbi:MAG: hypothetical protein IPM56_05000 [Ignavibacteriales bacterium]|nr:MAG: hypothetical protein IPM56_05000 [Ignavibacteriales bacterium]